MPKSDRKLCPVCNTSKLKSLFPPAEATDDGLAYTCQECLDANRETWKPVPGPINYEVSNLGRVRRKGHQRKAGRAGLRWTPPKDVEPMESRGSVSVRMTGANGKKYRRTLGSLVLTVFYRAAKEGEVTRHFLDPNPFNSCLENLRWGTQSENVLDEIRHYGKHHNKGVKRSAETRAKMSAANRNRKLSIEQIEAMRQRQTGKKASEETKAKMSAKHKERFQDPETLAKQQAQLAEANRIRWRQYKQQKGEEE